MKDEKTGDDAGSNRQGYTLQEDYLVESVAALCLSPSAYRMLDALHRTHKRKHRKRGQGGRLEDISTPRWLKFSRDKLPFMVSHKTYVRALTECFEKGFIDLEFPQKPFEPYRFIWADDWLSYKPTMKESKRLAAHGIVVKTTTTGDTYWEKVPAHSGKNSHRDSGKKCQHDTGKNSHPISMNIPPYGGEDMNISATAAHAAAAGGGASAPPALSVDDRREFHRWWHRNRESLTDAERAEHLNAYREFEVEVTARRHAAVEALRDAPPPAPVELERAVAEFDKDAPNVDLFRVGWNGHVTAAEARGDKVTGILVEYVIGAAWPSECANEPEAMRELLCEHGTDAVRNAAIEVLVGVEDAVLKDGNHVRSDGPAFTELVGVRLPATAKQLEAV